MATKKHYNMLVDDLAALRRRVDDIEKDDSRYDRVMFAAGMDIPMNTVIYSILEYLGLELVGPKVEKRNKKNGPLSIRFKKSKKVKK